MSDNSKMYCVFIGVICVTALEMTALIMRLDGQYMSIVVGAISAIVGAYLGIKITESKAVKSVTEG